VRCRQNAGFEFRILVSHLASWSLPGETRDGIKARGFYLPSAINVQAASLLWMAETDEIRRGGSLSIISGGQVTASESVPLVLSVNGKALRLRQQALLGLGYAPYYLWRTEDGRPLAAMTGWDIAIQESQESLAGALEEAAEKDLRARMHALGISSQVALGATYALTHVDVFDPNTLTRKLDQTVVVAEGRIRQVGSSAGVSLPEGMRTVACPGKTLLPGLWDSHSHIGTQTDGLIALASGSVCIYSPGDDPRKGLALRQAWDRGDEAGPWATSALLLDGPGANAAQGSVIVDSREDVLKALEKARREGYFGIKIYGSLKKELVPFIIQEGRKQGFWLSGHVPAGYTIQDLVGLGFQEANHIYFAMLGLWPDVQDKTNGMARFTTIAERAQALDLKGTEVRDLIACFKKHGTVVDPTAVVLKQMLDHTPGTRDSIYGGLFERLPALARRAALLNPDLAANPQERTRNQASMRKVLGFIRELHEAGVPVVPGTDNFAPCALAQELILYVEAGIPAPEVLSMATIKAARTFGQDKETGTIEAGKRADFVLVEGDPTQDIRALERMAWVSRGGKVYDREKILEGFGISPRR